MPNGGRFLEGERHGVITKACARLGDWGADTDWMQFKDGMARIVWSCAG